MKNDKECCASFKLANILTEPIRTPWLILCWLICSVTFTEPVQGGCADHLSRSRYEVAVEWKGQCYTYHNRLSTCDLIYKSCEELGGFAAKIISLEQQRHIYRGIADVFYNGNVNLLSTFWIGLKYDETIGDWKWANDDPVTWTNWKSRPDKNSCMEVRDMEGTWIERVPPYFGDGYICEIRQPLKPTTTSPPTTPGTTRMVTTSTTTVSATTTDTTTHDATSTTTPVPETAAQTTSTSTTLKPTEITTQRLTPAKEDHLTERRTYFVAKRGLGKHPYVSAKPNAVIKSWTMLSCCTKCMLLPGCWLVNYSLVQKTCRLYINQDALGQVEQERGWLVFVAKIDYVDM